MDRSWMKLSRVSNDYRNGVQTFLNFAFQNASQENMILCPCKKCGNINWHFREVVYEHLIVDGFIRGYIKWIFHGECTLSRTTSTINPAYPCSAYHQSVREDDMKEKKRRGRLRNLNIVRITPNSAETNSEQHIAVESSNVPKTLDEPAEIQTESCGTRRARGCTLLKDLYELNPVERAKVSRNNRGQPVRFWNSKKREDRERVGTSSRQKQKLMHTAGSKNFTCVAEAEELSSSRKVGHLQLFDITHRKKDGSPMTSAVGEIMEKLKDEKEEYEAIASSDSSINLEDIDNRIITEVLGPERYCQVRFQESSVNPTQYFRSSSQQYMLSGSQAQAEVQRLRDQIAQIQASTVEQIAQLKAEAVAREAEQNRKHNELQLQLQNMMKMFQQSQIPPS